MYKFSDLKLLLSAIIILFGLTSPSFAQQETRGEASQADQGQGDDQKYARDIALMQKRIAQLEGQVVDMQVIIGTLESLVKQQNQVSNISDPSQSGFGTQVVSGAPVNNGQSGQSERIDILETQMRALSDQMSRLSQQSQNRAGGNGDVEQNAGQDNVQKTQGFYQKKNEQFGFGSATVYRDGQQQGQAQSDDLGKKIASLPKENNEGDNALGSNPVILYDKAKGHLWRRDFAAAELAFKDFLKLHAKDKLAGDAQFWLGVTYYERKNYRAAADNFLKVYKKFRDGKRAPDSLLRLALSLQKLGEKQAACATFVQLTEKYPSASEAILNEASNKMKSLKCRS